MTNFGICFSKEFKGDNPLSHTGKKLSVYLQLLKFCENEGWRVYILTRRTYRSGNVFDGGWLLDGEKFLRTDEPVNINIVYDLTGGIAFPPEGENLNVVNRRDFKLLCWDKWAAYKLIGKYMPNTFWVGEDKERLGEVLKKTKTNWVVLKPFNGLKGKNVYIGSKANAYTHNFEGKKYIAQEFVDTSGGIKGIVEGLHDLRVAIVNKKIVWSHVRTPPKGTYAANVARGGTLTEIGTGKIPEEIFKIVKEISERFYEIYDNPIYSLDFGMRTDGRPYLFEINDSIGFPTWEMEARDIFLRELVKNFKLKI